VLSSLATLAPAFHGAPVFWPFFIIGPIFWFIVLVLIVILVTTGRRRRMARWAAWGNGGAGPWGHGFGSWGAGRSAEATLAERFAQGDIDEKEYRARLEVLRANNGPQQAGGK
jgi:putative membrane protein